MCGATCPLVDDLAAGNFGLSNHLHGAAIAGKVVARTTPAGAQRNTSVACPALYGIAVLDTEGRVRFCSEGAARAFGTEPENLSGRAIASLVPDLKLRPGTPGYNLAYALFWFPRQQWRRVEALTYDGHPFPVEVSISATRIDGHHQLLIGLRHARVTRGGRGAQDGMDADCAGAAVTPLQRVESIHASRVGPN